ncbi:hypothetical protein SE18_15005 [Herpetosiphon geysericola]|uniref:Uncharacterized protein n=2 Tax=Herpetosiphon geysericola TaxID=70996 RepID=A0A0P6XQE0_9CHLR|nr:hypothetical protein SE18_15005 [Herpetosiphon geysericola]
MEPNDLMQALRVAIPTEQVIHESLRESFQKLSHSLEGFVVLNPPPQLFDDFMHPRIHPSRVGDPPAQGCDAAPNRKPKPWESVRWQPRRKY